MDLTREEITAVLCELTCPQCNEKCENHLLNCNELYHSAQKKLYESFKKEWSNENLQD